VNALILRDARLDDAEDVARFTCAELAAASSKPSLRPVGLVVPTWLFPAAAVGRIEPVETWPRLTGVRIWVGKQAIVFLTPGGGGPVMEAAAAFGYPTDRQTKWMSRFDPKSTLTDL
jgi:hypothetical protein